MKRSKKEEKLKISKLTQDWTQEDWEKFSEWWNKQDLNNFDELVVVDMPEDRPLKEGDKIRGTHIKKRAYDRITVFDLKHKIKRTWIPILVNESLDKETADKLNLLFISLKEKLSIDSSTQIFTIFLIGVLFLIKYCKSEKSSEYATPIDIKDLLNSDFLLFLLGRRKFPFPTAKGKIRTCELCGKLFISIRSDQIFCSPNCAKKASYRRITKSKACKKS